MADSSIEWTDKTWNPTRGCSLVSPGCERCYAMKQAHRFAGAGGKYEGLTRLGKHGPVWTGDVRQVPSMLVAPLRWRKPQRVFVDSMSDLFHEEVSNEFIAAVFGIMAACPQHTFQVLTKRAERLPRWFEWLDVEARTCNAGRGMTPAARCLVEAQRASRAPALQRRSHWPLRNVQLGVSVEDQPRAEERIHYLMKTPAAVRLLSLEPLISAIDLRPITYRTSCRACSGRGTCGVCDRGLVDKCALDALDWVIVGGESGPGARPFDLEWGRSLIHQCRGSLVPVFMKQLGGNPIMEPGPLTWPCEDPKGGDPSEWPEDLRVREYPIASAS